VAGNRITIGALTTHAALAASDALRASEPVLWTRQPARRSAGAQPGNDRGASGMAIAADYPAVLLALDATFTLAVPTRTAGSRRRFFHGMFETALASTEVLTAIAFDAAPASAYVKFHHPASH